MKRIILSSALILAVCAQGVRAQVKVDVDLFKKQMAKSDEDIANPKKNAKSAVWLTRGQLFLDIANAPLHGIYVGLDEKSALLTVGQPEAEPTMEKVGDNTYKVIRYSTLTAYYKDEAGTYKVAFWNPTLTITDNPLHKSLEAYMKAYELDQKNATAEKIKFGQQSIGNAYKQNANNSYSFQKYVEAADAFSNAYDAQLPKPYAYSDTLAAFNAGFLYTVAQSWEKGIVRLNQALSYNYENDGEVYYYLYHCYYGLKQNDKAREALLKGLDHFPTNPRIIEGLLSLYTTTGEGNPKDIVPVVIKAIESDPTNSNLQSGLGLIYDRLGEPDKAIEAFAKSVKLNPGDFGANFNLGLLYVKKSDKMRTELSRRADVTRADYDNAVKEINKEYMKAIAPLEKALSIQPSSVSTIELLKNLFYQIRDEPGMMENYEKYKAMHEALPNK